MLDQNPWYNKILFKDHATNSNEAFIFQERHSTDKSFLAEESLRSPIDVLRKSIRFLTSNSDLKTKVITSEGTFRRNICGMVLY